MIHVVRGIMGAAFFVVLAPIACAIVCVRLAFRMADDIEAWLRNNL